MMIRHSTRGVRSAVAGVLAAVMVTATAACSTGSGTSGGAGESGGASGAFPVSIQSSLGEVTIPSEPKRVVTLGWGSTEAAVALGVVPVGMRDMSSDTGTDDGVLPWVGDALGGTTPELLEETSKSLPVEKIAALRPDVILAVQSGLTADQYAQLSRIAPTVASPGKSWQTSWQDQATIVGKALGREAEARKKVDEAQALLAEARSAHPEFGGKTVAVAGATTQDGLNYYFDTDPRTRMLGDLGFTPLPALAGLREKSPEGKFAAAVSWENVPSYAPDVLPVWYLDKALQSGAESNPVFADLGPVKKKGYIPLTDPPLVFAVSSPNVLNMKWMLDRYVPKLSEAAKATG